MEDRLHARTALLLVDLINPFDYPEGDAVLDHTRRVLPNISRLTRVAREKRSPVIYVNDNFGRWRSHFPELVSHCERGGGADVVRALRPEDEDFFVLKPHRSGFYATPLELLLRSFGTEALIITGLVTEMCILATASDARIRNYSVHVPCDCTASSAPERRERALRVMQDGFAAEIGPSTTASW